MQADNAGTNEKASGIKTVQYQIKKNADTTWGALQTSGTFTGLVQNTKYDVRTHAVDKAGNTSDSLVTTVTTGTIGAVGTASISPTGWTNGNVTVTLPKSDGFKTMYTTDGTTPTAKASTTTKEYSSPFEVSSNCTIMYVYTDGNNINTAGTISVQKIDKTAPTNTAPTATYTTNSITVTSRQADNAGTNEQASGINSVQYSKDNGSTWQSGATFTGLTQNNAYTIKTRTTDNAGNVTVSQSITVTTNTIGAVGTAIINPTGWTNGNVTVTLPTSSGFTTMYTTDGSNPTATATTASKKYTGVFTVTSNCTIMYVYTDGTNVNTAGTIKVEKIDKTAPTNTAPTATHTTSTITVTNKQTDSGGSGINSVQYSKDNGSTWQASNVFSGLKQNTAYTIKTKTTDKAGNTTDSQSLSVTTGTIGAVGTASANPSSWTNGNVTVTLPKADGFTTKYTTDGTAPTINSTTYSSPFTVSSNCTIMFIYTDGTNTNTASSLGIGNIDKTAPTDTAPTATAATDTITVTNKQTDSGGSGIKSVQYSVDNGSTWQNSNTFTGLKPKTTYTIKTKTTDNAGNVTESKSTTATTSKLTADQVGYTPSDSSWSVTNVKEALDSLYNKIN